MDISNIPKTFWYSLSFCMVVGTLGLLVIAYKASSVSIEIANAKISIFSAVAQAKEIKSDLEAKSKQLASENRFTQEVDEWKTFAKGSKSAVPDEELTKRQQQSIEEKEKSKFDALDAKIRFVEETIKR